MSSAYSSFRGGLYKYEVEQANKMKSMKGRFLNRSPPGVNTPKKHIMKNIRQI